MSRTSTTKQNLSSIRSGFFLPIYVKYTPSNLRMFTSLFSWFFRSPTGETVGRILTLNTSYDAVLLQGSAFWGLENLNLIFNLFIRKTPKHYNGAYGENVRNFKTVITSVVYTRVVIFGSTYVFRRWPIQRCYLNRPMPRPTLVAMATKFELKLAITRFICEISPRSLRLAGGFRGRAIERCQSNST